MKSVAGKFDNFVDHPRYGKSPHFTGLNPDAKSGSDAFLHWHSPKECRIPSTAIAANRSQQNAGMGYVTHYFDVTRDCVDCNRMFLFFAQEQRYWYEILKFNLSANCVRCVECRKTVRGAESLRKRYDQLVKASNLTESESLELAGCCITLIERSVFGPRSIQIARESLNRIPEDSRIRKHATFRNLCARSTLLLTNGG